MSEEDIKKAEEEKAKLIETIANLEQDKANVVSELVAKRESERLAKEELERVKKEKGSDFNNTDPTEIVEKVLQKKEQEASQNAFELAKTELKRKYNEFSPETDSAGIVFKKFESEMSKFNFSGLRTKEEYANRLDEVYEHMNRTKHGDEKAQFYSGQRQSGSDTKTTDGSNLSDAESRLIRELGWDKERYLKQKEKRPAYIASLLKYRG